jgi:hypothetical protein
MNALSVTLSMQESHQSATTYNDNPRNDLDHCNILVIPTLPGEQQAVRIIRSLECIQWNKINKTERLKLIRKTNAYAITAQVQLNQQDLKPNVPGS